MTKIVKVQALNDSGLREFRKFIRDTRESERAKGELLPGPNHLLTGAAYLTDYDYEVKVDLGRDFSTRYEFGKYLVEQFGGSFKDDYYSHPGMWAWLALAYLDQLRNTKLKTHTGKRTATQREEHFVPHEWDKGSGRDLGYRHSVRAFFRLVKVLGKDAKFYAAKGGMHEWGDVAEQLTSNPKINSSAVIRQLIFDLYRAKDGHPARGTTNHRPSRAKARNSKNGYGKMRRLTHDYLSRIELTYDVEIMSPDEIRKLCGKEFA